MNSKEPIRILLVDDDSALLRSLVRVFNEYEFEVETSTCAAEASVLLNRNDYEVLVCDQNMPGKTGLEFLSEVAERKPDLIAMMLSGQVAGIPVAEQWANEIGVVEVFNKPCDAGVVAESILSAVRDRRSRRSTLR